MEATDFDRVFVALENAGVRYLVVGGVAVLLHGHLRFTADIDIVLALDESNVLAAIRALGALGYKPRAPVKAEALADANTRRSWLEDKGLTVLSLWSPSLPATEVDLFVEEPFPFDEAYARALRADLAQCTVSVAGIADLIALKERAGRPKDLEDVRALRDILADTEGDP